MGYRFENKLRNFSDPDFPVYSSNPQNTGTLVTPHFHEAIEFIKFRSGSAKVFVDTNIFSCKENDIVLVPPYSIHSVVGGDAACRIRGVLFDLSMIHADFCDFRLEEVLSKDRVRTYVFSPDHPAFERLNSCVEDIIARYPVKTVPERFDMISELYKLLGILMECFSDEITDESHRIFPVIEYIKKNYNRPIRIAELSRILNVCDDYLIRLFKAYTNKTPMKYLQDLRVEEAMKLLINSDLSIAEIAERVGFSSSNYMSAAFQAAIKMTPREYRKKSRLG